MTSLNPPTSTSKQRPSYKVSNMISKTSKESDEETTPKRAGYKAQYGKRNKKLKNIRL